MLPSHILQEPSKRQDWARLMAKMHARAITISDLLGITIGEARSIYLNVHSRSSPSGQRGTDITWCARSTLRRYHSAMIIILVQNAMKPGVKFYEGFTHAYYHYSRMTAGLSGREYWTSLAEPAFRANESDYVIPFSRAQQLVLNYNDEPGRYGGRDCPVQLRCCTKCQSKWLALSEEVFKRCPLCRRQESKKDPR